MQSLTDLN